MKKSKSMMHPDYWCEVPAGEFEIGLSDRVKERIWRMLLQFSGYDDKPPEVQAQMDAALQKMKNDEKLDQNESRLFVTDPTRYTVINMISSKMVFVERFYIARYRITSQQYNLFELYGKSPYEIHGTHEEPEVFVPMNKQLNPMIGRTPAMIPSYEMAQVFEFCGAFGGRLPTPFEWHKAAKGVDERLYPWGNDWHEEYGWFYPGQYKGYTGEIARVDSFPQNVSPYGVQGMLGGYNELIEVGEAGWTGTIEVEWEGKLRCVRPVGTHPSKVYLPERSFIEYIVTLSGGGGRAPFALRPVMDEWPQTLWRGVAATSSGYHNN